LTSRTESPQILHWYFEEAVRRWPGAVAVEVPPGPGRPGRRSVAYRDLDALALAIAARLPAPIPADALVAVLLPRDTERLYAAQLGILRAGGAYVCLDPAFPDAQVAAILADASPVALLTDSAGQARARRLNWDSGPVLDVTGQLERPAGAPSSRTAGPEDLAYLIYTSGTTGRPKGVMIEHRSIASLVASDLLAFGLGPGDRVAQNSSPAYDSSVEETWLALASGATLVVMDEAAVRLGPDLVPWLQKEAITVLCPPPTLLRAASGPDPARALPDLRLLYVGGEALTPDVAGRWAPGRRLVNGYGPTECTVTAVRGEVRAGEPVTIGRPVPGMCAWVLDEAMEEVPPGCTGELCLGGVGLARGYRGNPQLSAERFPLHPRLGRIYRTGDRARREPDGALACLGRIDAQVKVRGYRIELEAVEAHLAGLPGIREAACTVQGDASPQLVAFVVPEDPARAPEEAALQEALARILPAPMVPARIGRLDTLPRSLGGKLDRPRLPPLQVLRPKGPVQGPRTPEEASIVAAFRAALPGAPEIAVDDDFFTALGGDSLAAALCISVLREDPATASLAVRDLYEARTPEALARRIQQAAAPVEGPGPPLLAAAARPFWTTAGQALGLLLGLLLGAPLAWWTGFRLLPALVDGLGLVAFLLLSPVLGLLGLGVYTLGAAALAVLAKRVLVGRYTPLRVPAWSGWHLRHWMVQQTARLIPWRLLEGTVAQAALLRALGARIGEGVHFHRGVSIAAGGWDLLEIGDGASLSQDAALRMLDLDQGCLVLGTVRIGPGATLETRAGMGPGTELGAGAVLGPLSALAPGARVPAGERWEGVPARPKAAVPAPDPATVPPLLSPSAWSAALLLAEAGLAALLALPAELVLLSAAFRNGIDGPRVNAWLARPDLGAAGLLHLVLQLALAVPATLLLAAAVCRLLGRVREGTLPRWSLAYLRVWLKGGLVQGAGEWLSGTLFWPHWLRLAGMKVGPGCEISTILDVVPELVEIGPECFLADGIYLGGPVVHQGTVHLARLRLAANTFLGNHAVVPAGRDLPADLLVGVCTAVDALPVRQGSSWFGLPPFELPNREVVVLDRRFTHEPGFVRIWNRVFWEAGRFTLPVLPTLALLAWCAAVAAAEARLGAGPAFLFGALPLLGLALAVFFPAVILALKWFLVGRVRPGVHPLWSCWCSRWDFLYVAWAMYARAGLAALEGSLLLTAYLRAMGMRIGRGVLLGPGFAQVVDPDMLAFGDGATVAGLFQAHTFEDRVLKIDRVDIRAGATVGSGAVLLYGADIGPGARVAPHSVVMKRERLQPGLRYEGCPTRPAGRA